MRSLFEICEPREDVRRGMARDADFAADLSKVIRGDAPPEYRDAATFFANTHPTVGLRAVLKNVGLRLSGRGGEAASVFRLDTQYGGGKTHALIALAHMAAGMKGVAQVEEFMDPGLVPAGGVRVAAFDGENADPANGRLVAPGVRAHTPWGELAYALGGAEGFARVQRSDEARQAPGADTLTALFGGQPTLILLDELSIYLRKVKGRPDAEQLAPFLTALFKAIETTPRAAIVFTLAVGKDARATDAYAEENDFVARKLEEAEKIAARKATVLDPTAEHEAAQVLRRRLFSQIDEAAAAEVVNAYARLWAQHADRCPPARSGEDRVAEFRRGFPLHPALMSAMTDKLSTLANFQRVRGMLRLVTRAVGKLWTDQPASTSALHLHHLDPGYDPIHNEIVTKLGQAAFDPAIRNDVSGGGGGLSLAEQQDEKNHRGLAPYTSFVARTALWHTLAFNDHLKGCTPEELNYSVLAPGLDLSFVEEARKRFQAESAYMDDRPGAPLRFQAEANLNQIVRRHEEQVDPDEVRAELRARIEGAFRSGPLELVLFPAGPYDVDDDASPKPRLVVLSYDAETVRGEALRVPDLVERIFRTKGNQGDYRHLQNHVVFLVADDVLCGPMKAAVVRRLALEAMRRPENREQLAAHQADEIDARYRKAEQFVATAVQQCYRHLFFPSRDHRIEGSPLDLAHVAFDVSSASEQPGNGQRQVVRALRDQSKLLDPSDPPLAPAFVRDRTPLKKGQISTADLRAEFRKDPRLPIMVGDENFAALIRKGIEEGLYVYRREQLLHGPGDPFSSIQIDAQSFVYRMDYAREHGIWPRQAAKQTGVAQEGTPAFVPGGLPFTPGGQSTPGVGGVSPTPPGVRTFKREAPLRQALTEIWEDARKAKVATLATLTLQVFDHGDAFRLLTAIGSAPAADRRVEIAASYETPSKSLLELTFRGSPADAGPVKEFLDAQFRAAAEKDMTVTYRLGFTDGLALSGDAPEKLAERLTRFATGAALVTAIAESKAEAS